MEEFEEKSIEEEIAEFEKEWSEQEEEVESETDPQDGEETEETEETDASDPTEDEDNSSLNESAEEKPPVQDPKANEAFAKMRKELQEKSKYAAIVERLAEQNGMTPDEIVKQFEQRQMQQEAEKQNIPVEIYQKLKHLEQENMNMRREQFSQKFNAQVEEVKQKYSLNEDEVKQTIDYMAKNGFDYNRVPFEDVYKLANFDKILEKEKHEARQKELEEKRKRQNSAAIPNGESVSEQDTVEWTDEAWEKEMQRLGISID